MKQIAQVKLLAVLAAVLLSILGLVAYEHSQAETQRRQAEQWKRDMLREEQDPNRPKLQTSDALRKY